MRLQVTVFGLQLKSRVADFVFLWSIVYGLSSFSQTASQLVKAGDKNFSEGNYFVASQYYQDAVKKDEENPELNYKLAESFRMFNDYGSAATVYKKVIKLDKENQFPLASFYLGLMLRSVCECKTTDAQAVLKKFRTKYRKKDFYNAKSLQELEACSWALDHLNPNDSVNIEHLGKEVNTEKSEFNAIHVYPDKLQFSSLRNLGDEKNKKYLVRIYNQKPNPENIYMPNGSDASLHIGNGNYSPDVKQFFFTQCEQKDKATTRCDIFLSKYDGFKWSDAQKLNLNDGSATNTHPAFGYDEKGNEGLYFSSDRKGGQGGLDIWFSKKKSDGTYESAVNLGKTINSQGNEVTPFYDSNNNKLFFSSDWHYGFGGFDIFESHEQNTTWTTPKNLMQPVNTSQNDLYYSLASDGSRAYITSNRKGSYYIEAETCCNDIYAYNTGKKNEKRDTVITAKVDTPVAENKTEEKKVVEEKVKKVNQILPVLYFHNDEPDAKTLNDTTRLDYKTTYEAYSALRGEYTREYSKIAKGDDKKKMEEEIEKLFDEKVDGGYYNLIAFTSQLYDLLEGGNKLEVTIKGYCSPLNFNEYNIKLGYRRVASLRNYFFHYRDGILLPFIAKGLLNLKTVSFGEETAPKGISDSREDKQQSVYSPAAALERRVEVLSVELK